MWITITGILVGATTAFFGIWSEDKVNKRNAIITSLLTGFALIVGIYGAYSTTVDTDERHKVIVTGLNKQLNAAQENLDVAEKAATQSDEKLKALNDTLSRTRRELETASTDLKRLQKKISSPIITEQLKLGFIILLPKEFKAYQDFYNHLLNAHASDIRSFGSSVDQHKLERGELELSYRWKFDVAVKFYFEDEGGSEQHITYYTVIDSEVWDEKTNRYNGRVEKMLGRIGLVVDRLDVRHTYNMVNRQLRMIDFNRSRVEVHLNPSFPLPRGSLLFGLGVTNKNQQTEALMFPELKVEFSPDGILKFKKSELNGGYIYKGRFGDNLNWRSKTMQLMAFSCSKPIGENRKCLPQSTLGSLHSENTFDEMLRSLEE